MSKLKITPGKWTVLDDKDTEGMDVYSGDYYIGSTWSKGSHYPKQVHDASRANAAFIAEAGTVANETGLTPRELMEQRDKAVTLLRELRDAVSEEATKPGMKFVEALIAKHNEANAFLTSLTSPK